MKKALAFLLALVLVLTLVGCASNGKDEAEPSLAASAEADNNGSADTENDASTATEERKLIGFSNASSDEYGMLVYNIFNAYCDENGYDVLHISADSSGEKQLSDIEDMITKGVDCVYIRAWDADAIVPAIEACVEANIPTVVADYPVNTEAASLYFTVDQTGYGVAQASYVIGLLENDPDLVINLCYLWGSYTFAPAQLRRDGVVNTLQPYIDEGRVNLLDEQSIEMDGSKIMSKTEDWITRFPDANCFIGANDDIADGMASTLMASGYVINEDAWVLGIDGTEVGLNDVKSGVISGTVSYNIEDRTHQMLDYVFELIEGKTFGETEEEKTITLQANETLVTLDNVDEYL